jgi:glycosyltransferase involved in cell wall biosynthesis
MTELEPTSHDGTLVAEALPRAVLFLTHALSLGGVTTHMTVLGRELVRRGIRVGVVTHELNEREPFGLPIYREAGLEVFQAPFAGYGLNWLGLRRTVRSVRRMRQIVRTFEPDLLHVHAPTLCLVARALRRPYVTTFHISVTGPKKCQIARAANRLLSRPFGRCVIAISNHLAADLEQRLCMPRETIRLVTYTVDDTRFSAPTPAERELARATLGVPSGSFVIGMVAGLEPRKNHGLLLDALGLLKQQGTTVVALLAGGGGWHEYSEAVRVHAASLGLGNSARFLGHAPASQVYHASDVFVLTSRQEGFPLSVIEAMLSGLVPIRTPSEGADEQIIDGETGYIVPFDRPDILAERISTLAGNPALRQRMSDAAQRSVRLRFRAGRMADETLEVYREALGR